MSTLPYQINNGWTITNPDPTTVIATDPRPDSNFDLPGIALELFDPILGYSRYLWVQNKYSGSTAVGDVTVFSTDSAYNLTIAVTYGTAAAQGPRTQYAGIAVSIIPTTQYGWIQTDGYCSVVQVATDTYINGMGLMPSATAKIAAKTGAAGTAPTYSVIGRALAAQTGSSPYYVIAQLTGGKF